MGLGVTLSNPVRLPPTPGQSGHGRLPHSLGHVLASGFLDVGDGHRIYWETSGNPQGLPVVYLHGGPGAGCGPSHRRFFDPKHYFIVLLDQRGAGRSTPRAGFRHNTTQLLVDDLEKLRCHLKISQWVLFGGSWGSTLALAYGQAYPTATLGFILRGVFLGSDREIDWFLNGMGRFRPDAQEAFLQALPLGERDAPLVHYYQRLCNPDPAIHAPAARAWARYEDACSHVGASLVPTPPVSLIQQEREWRTSTPSSNAEPCLPIARLEAHYMMHRCFLAPDQLLDGIAHIAHLPCIIVQGACDLVCPPESAWAIHHRWRSSTLHLIADAGHSVMEPGIQDGLLAATSTMRSVLSQRG